MKKGDSLSKKVMAARTKQAADFEEQVRDFMEKEAFKAQPHVVPPGTPQVEIFDGEDDILMDAGSADYIIGKYGGTDKEHNIYHMKLNGKSCHASVRFLMHLKEAYISSKELKNV